MLSPPVCASVRVSVCLLSRTRLLALSADKAVSRSEPGSLQSVNNFQRGVTLNGKAFSTLSAGNWTII